MKNSKVVYFRECVHLPGGPLEAMNLSDDTIVTDIGLQVQLKDGRLTIIPWSNVKNIIIEKDEETPVIPLNKNVKKAAKS